MTVPSGTPSRITEITACGTVSPTLNVALRNATDCSVSTIRSVRALGVPRVAPLLGGPSDSTTVSVPSASASSTVTMSKLCDVTPAPKVSDARRRREVGAAGGRAAGRRPAHRHAADQVGAGARDRDPRRPAFHRAQRGGREPDHPGRFVVLDRQRGRVQRSQRGVDRVGELQRRLFGPLRHRVLRRGDRHVELGDARPEGERPRRDREVGIDRRGAAHPGHIHRERPRRRVPSGPPGPAREPPSARENAAAPKASRGSSSTIVTVA